MPLAFPEDLSGAAPRFIRRQVRHLGQLRHAWGQPKRVSFVFGCQRSGTKLLMRVIGQSPAARIYHENHASAFRDFQLRSDATIRALIAASPAPVQLFKPICDSHRADEILDAFDGSRGLWIWRDPYDVARSAVNKWGEHQLEVVRSVVEGGAERWGWRTARIPADVVEDLARVHRSDLTPLEGALLFWYMRNSFFFSLGLDRDPRVGLLRYSQLVSDPENFFQYALRHVGTAFSAAWTAQVRASSVGRGERRASPEIQALCDGLVERFNVWKRPSLPLVSPVLLLIDTLGTGGAERYVVTVANWLAERGVVVTVASSGGVQVADLDDAVRHIHAPLKHVRTGLPRAALAVREIIEKIGPKAIVANSLAVTLVARAAQLRRQVPIINVAHGWPEHRFKRVAPLMRVADRVVAVSPDVGRKLVAAGLDDARCEVVYNGVDCRPLGRREGVERARAREALGAGPEDLSVAIVGRLEAQKAHQHVITVAQTLWERLPRLRFGIVGNGGREEELQQLIEAAGVGDRVRLLGRRMDVPELLGSADLYLNCSDWEGMPLTTIEAMASELPIVATCTEGSDQLLTPETGFVVPVGDAEAMAAALTRLAEDGELRLKMGQAARRRALAHFSHERMVSQLAEVVAEAAWALPEWAGDHSEEGR